MLRSRLLTVMLAAALVGACGDEETEPTTGRDDGAAMAAETPTGTATPEPAAATGRKGTRLRTVASQFGRILGDGRGQAFYLFDKEKTKKAECYGACAKAWPPVLTKGKPRAGKGTDASLLGTTTRRDGKLQVTYAGKPLYYYAHEAPGEVKCHNVNLNGGFWWVVGPDGKRRA